MTPVEDRTRAAMDAITGLVESVPPLELPPLPDGAPRSWRHRGVPWPRRRGGSWLAPVAAAAAVLAVALTLVTVRNMPGGQTAPAGGPAISLAGAPVSFPDYYLAFDQLRTDATIPVSLVLGATLTGKKLFTLRPPHGLSFAGITGAADDRTFVADAHRDPYGAGSGGRSRTWYLVRIIGAGSRASLTMTRLPIPPTPVGTGIQAIALSPDGSMLAVASTSRSDNPDVPEVLRVYSVATGAVLHSWSTGPPDKALIGGAGYFGGDDNESVSWVGDRALAYYTVMGTGPAYSSHVMVLDISQPDGNLVASSRIAATVPFDNSDNRAAFGCSSIYRSDVMITGDGKTMVCGGEGTSGADLPKALCGKGPAWNTAAFAGYSLATGKLTSFLSGFRTNCYGYALADPYPLWVNATGSTLIGWMYLGAKLGGRFGVFSHGSFRPLPNPVPGNWYQYMSGSMLGQVVW